MAIRRASRAIQLALVLLVLFAAVTILPANAEEGVEQQQPEEPQHQESPPVQEERNSVEEEAPPGQEEEAPPIQEEETPPIQEESHPGQHEEPPVQHEEPPVQEEPPRDDSPPPIDEAWFKVNVFECKAPQGDPIPPRVGPVTAKAVMALCFRPQTEDQATLKSINFMEFSAIKGPTQAAISDNTAAGPMTRVACPMPSDEKLCITATKLDNAFFSKSYSKAAAKGEVTIVAGGEERVVSFEHNFSTQEAPKQEKIEHDYFEFPATPPPFPCSREIRIWVLLALILTLLEFAFSPDGDSLVKQASGESSKKKKNKKE